MLPHVPYRGIPENVSSSVFRVVCKAKKKLTKLEVRITKLQSRIGFPSKRAKGFIFVKGLDAPSGSIKTSIFPLIQHYVWSFLL